MNGAKTVRIHGEEIPVRARISPIESLSAHGDKDDLLRWLSGFSRPPRGSFVVHGEPEARNTFAAEVKKRLGWRVEAPEYLEEVLLR